MEDASGFSEFCSVFFIVSANVSEVFCVSAEGLGACCGSRIADTGPKSGSIDPSLLLIPFETFRLLYGFAFDRVAPIVVWGRAFVVLGRVPPPVLVGRFHSFAWPLDPIPLTLPRLHDRIPVVLLFGLGAEALIEPSLFK